MFYLYKYLLTRRLRKTTSSIRCLLLMVLICIGNTGCYLEITGEVTVDSDTDNIDMETESETPTTSMFDSMTPIKFQVDMPDSDWKTLCSEGRTLTQIGCEDFSFTDFQATVTIEGQTFEAVEIRKKGFLGSLSTIRPSLKLDLAANNKEQRFWGAKKITLNNDRQDATHLRQCLAYQLFRDAGVAAPRCGLADVTVNGESLGIYTNIEPIKKPFLERVFGDDSGNLYEAQGVDITLDQYERVELKTNEKTADISDLKALAEVLALPDSSFETELARVVNIDAFYTFWAMEVLTGHWDGYFGNRNNFYLYHNPVDDLFYFIPWGTDGTFVDENGFRPADQPDATLYPNGELSRRLFALDNGARLKNRVNELASAIWNEETIIARAYEISAAAGTTLNDTDQIIRFITYRKEQLALDLNVQMDVSTPTPGRNVPMCELAQPSAGAIEVNWSSDGAATPAVVESLQLIVEGRPLEFAEGSVIGLAGPSSTSVDTIEIYVIGSLRGTERIVWLGFNLPISQYQNGTWPFHGFETVGVVVALFPPNYEPGPILSVITEGQVTVERVSNANGETARLSWEGKAVDFIP